MEHVQIPKKENYHIWFEGNGKCADCKKHEFSNRIGGKLEMGNVQIPGKGNVHIWFDGNGAYLISAKVNRQICLRENGVCPHPRSSEFPNLIWWEIGCVLISAKVKFQICLEGKKACQDSKTVRVKMGHTAFQEKVNFQICPDGNWACRIPGKMDFQKRLYGTWACPDFRKGEFSRLFGGERGMPKLGKMEKDYTNDTAKLTGEIVIDLWPPHVGPEKQSKWQLQKDEKTRNRLTTVASRLNEKKKNWEKNRQIHHKNRQSTGDRLVLDR